MFSRNKLQKLVLVGFLIVISSMFSCGSEQEQEKLTIAVAANLQFAIEELVMDFSKDRDIACEVIVGSSGKLTAQIMEGAPFDLFLSADMKYPNDLYEHGFAIGEPVIYAYGKLILWTLKDDVDPELKSLTGKKVKHVAIGNPKTAPYGLAAMQVVDRLGIGNYLKDRFVYGESVSQTNQFILSKAADLGFTSKSVVMSGQIKDLGSWKEIDKKLYEPMAQGLVILNAREEFRDKAVEFRDFILTEQGRKILHKFGYDIAK